MTEKIDHFLKILPQLTKEEADLIEQVLKWDDETKAAFIFTKRIFEDEEQKLEWTTTLDKKKLPKKGQEVLTWDGRWIIQEEYDYEIDNESFFSTTGGSATHWMPLPLPPMENECRK